MVANIPRKQKIRGLGVEGVGVMARGKGGVGDDWGKFLGIVIGVGIGAFAAGRRILIMICGTFA